MRLKLHLDILVQDVRYAVRGFLRSPMFTLAAVFAVAIGTGAGTAVFSVVDRILFRSLPYPDAGRLVSFGMTAPIVPQEFLLGYDYLDWRERQIPFASLGAWTGTGDCDLNETSPVRLRCAPVDAHFLPALGIQPQLGRNFVREEDQPNAPRVALVSNALWRSRFGGDARVLGKTMFLDGQPARIVGVLPADFELPTLERADVLVPLALNEAEQRTRRVAILLSVIGRLKPGVNEDQAGAALQPLLHDALQYVSPEFRKEVKLRVRSLRDRQVQDARLASWILLAAVLSVLLIACANVANLLLARAIVRQRELAMRAALGASQGRRMRQTMTESLLLGLAGGAAGCVLAFILLRVFVALAPEGIPRLQQATLDWRVLLFTLSVSLVSGVLFGLAPALQDTPGEMLAGWRTLGRRQHYYRQLLVTAQIAVSLVLLAGASLLLRSLWNMQNQPLGMRTANVLTASITLGTKSYADVPRRVNFFEELEARTRRLPGVTGVAFSDSVPPQPTFGMMYSGIDVFGRPRHADPTGGMVALRSVTPGYFAVLGIPVLRGRAFEEADRGPGRDVVIISDALARRMFPGDEAIGKQIKPGRVGPWLTIIGVADNVKNSGLAGKSDPEYYVVCKHSGQNVGRGATVIIRSPGDPRLLARALRQEVAALDATLPVSIQTMDQQIGNLAERPRFNASLLALFAAMGLLLAAIGLYGVISFLVARRTAEIGVRMALGATPGAIERLVLRDALRYTASGVLLGLVGSLLATRWLGALLFRVSPRDPWMLGGAVLLLANIALGAAWIPSHRAARVDPAAALRQE